MTPGTLKRILTSYGIAFGCIFSDVVAQETNCRASGRIISEKNEGIEGATLTLIHEPTQAVFQSMSRKDGIFLFFNLKSGGPYLLKIACIGYSGLEIKNLFIHLASESFEQGNTLVADITLQEHSISLNEILVKSHSHVVRSGVVTDIDLPAIQALPSISRSLQDLVRLSPHAKVTGEGVISLAGQNNRFNAFYIDGADNSDIRGTAVNGMNGGQSGSSSISLEALEEIQVLLAPYDIQYGNFTGGSINAITRSGSNENKTSAWYFFRNAHMTGRSPEYIPNPSAPGTYFRPRLSPFFNQTRGAWNSGALIKSKLFYFTLVERITESRPQPFNFNDYRGNSTQQDLANLSDYLKSAYQYDPGSFLDSRDDLDATRIHVKLDWNRSVKHTFTLSYRFNHSERITAPRPSATNAISFQQSGIRLPSTTHAFSFEWRNILSNRMTNRLQATYIAQSDYRKWIGQPFPSVVIIDSNATITFGSENSTGVTRFNGNEWGFIDILTYTRRKNVYTLGMDHNLIAIRQAAIPGFFGIYTFRNLADFYTSNAPLRFQRSFYPNDGGIPAFTTLRSSIFFSDELRPSPHLKLNMGLRLDVNALLTCPPTDHFLNDTASVILSDYYDIHGTLSGQRPRPHWMLSPRAGFEYKLPRWNLILRGGAGIFLGRIVNIWLFDVFNSQSASIDIVTHGFHPDPYDQPTPESFQIDPSDAKGITALMDKHFKYPAVFRSTLAATKTLKYGWRFSAEGIVTRNIHEASFQNINIVPSTAVSAAPDARNVFSTNASVNKISFRTSGVLNPYPGIYFVTNNHGRRGSSFSISAGIQKQYPDLSLSGSYAYGHSRVLFEITGPQTTSNAQWRNMETVNGRNFNVLSASDNDPGHRLTAWINKRIVYGKGRSATILSVFYTGQSGNRYSYVYFNSMINDNGTRNEIFDLVYIPTEPELAAMRFLPITGANGTVLYTADQQKQSLNEFIDHDRYLRHHRGSFSQRNGARLPFTHLVDLSLQQEFIFKMKDKKIGITLRYDIFNFTNMLNRKWGRIWFLLNDSYPLITFVNWENTTTLTPQYRFTPFTGKPYALQSSTLPGNSARWTSQLGIKINVN